MKTNRKAFLIVIVLCAAYALLAIVVPKATKSYETAEEGIAQYAGIKQEEVLVIQTVEDDASLYTVWENTATKEVGMTVLQKQSWLGRGLLHPYMATGTGKTPYFNYYCARPTSQESLFIVFCDNRDGTLGHCELQMARYYEDNSPTPLSSWTMTFSLDESVMLEVFRFPGVVQGGGSAYDHEGNPVITTGKNVLQYG